jgi:hypothetical protein
MIPLSVSGLSAEFGAFKQTSNYYSNIMQQKRYKAGFWDWPKQANFLSAV